MSIIIEHSRPNQSYIILYLCLTCFVHALTLTCYLSCILSSAGPPNAVDEQSICVQPSLTSIALSWSAATSFPGYPVTGYTIELRNTTSESTVFSDSTSMTSVTIRDLHANQEYSLSIVTNSGSGNSDPASKIVMTAPLGEPASLCAHRHVL